MGVPRAPNGVRIQLLGGFRVWVGAHPIEDAAWRLNKSKAIVKLLALASGHSLARDQILEALWPRLLVDDAVNNFHQTLHAARRTLSNAWPSAGKEAVLSLRGQILSLRSPGWLSIDVDEFTRAATAAHDSPDVPHYEQALALYARDLLPEDRYEDWTAGHRDTLARSYRSLLLGLVGLHEGAGQFSDAINALNQALEHEPADEDVHVRLMRLYALTGQPHQAQRQYQGLQDILRRELDANPQPFTTRLLDDIMAARFPGPDAGERVAARPSQRARPARKRPPSPQGNLPTPLTSFIGRERELAALNDLQDRERLVTLTGPGGSGKTRLALELAARATQRFPDGTWWVDLQELRDSSLVPFEVAAQLGIREQPGRRIEASIARRLRGHQALIVLDNCEHLAAGCAALVEWLLQHCERLRILVTSREWLGLTGETRWRVPPLAVPPEGTELSADEVLQFESVQLFVSRSRYVRPEFAVRASDAHTVAQICRHLDGLPLLIELAAARTHLLSLEVIRDRLADRLSMFPLSGAVESRYRTASDAIGWSYGLLGEEERRLFNRLSVFAGPFTLEAAETICTDGDLVSKRVLDHLSNLVDKSMVNIDESPAGALRYRLLGIMRQYALERLHESDEPAQFHRRCYEWYLGLAEAAAPELNGRNQRFWFRRLEDEHANFRAVLAWCQAQEDGAERLVRLAWALSRYWLLHGYLHEGRMWTEAGLASGGQLPAALRARAHAAIGGIAKVQADWEVSRAHREEALKIFRAVGDRRSEGWMLRALGWLSQDLGEYAQARGLHQESLKIHREDGDKVDAAFTLQALGWMAQDQGDYVAARAMHDESLATFREAGEVLAVAISIRAVGLIAQDQCDYDAARSIHQQSLEIFREFGSPGGIAISLYSIGRVAHLTGDFEQATALYREGLAIFNTLGNRWGVGHRWGTGRCLHGLGEVARLKRETASARSSLQESLGCFRDLRFKEGIGLALAALGGVAVQNGDQQQARKLHVEALQLFGELGFKLRIAECLEGLAGLGMSEEDARYAARLLGAAAVLRDRMGTPIAPCARQGVDNAIASVRARLGPQGYAAEWEQGGRLSLDEALALAQGTSPAFNP